jgi:alpha-beta hydrolase superfamily lysophospholipase
MLRSFVALALLAAAAGPVEAQTRATLEAEWVGQIRSGDSTRYMELHARGDGQSQQLLVDFPLERVGGLPARRIAADDSVVRFELPIRDKVLSFAGRRTSEGVAGVVTENGRTSQFRLLRLARPNLARFEEINGNFEIIPRRIISVAQIQDVGDLPVFFDHTTRRMGLLLPVSDSVYIAGASLGVAYPVDIRATVRRDSKGAVAALLWEKRSNKPTIAKKLMDHERHHLKIRSGDATLSATLWMPTSPGAHAAIVNVAGPSGSGTRNQGETAPFFVSQGVAFLEYDKRGAGESTGDSRTLSVDDLVADAKSMVSYLQSRNDVDARRIGLWATSNGAWVVPAVASQSDVSFVIVRSVPALSVGDNLQYEVERDLIAAGFSDAEVKRGLALRHLFTETVLRGEGWDALAKAVKSEANERLLNEARTPRGLLTVTQPLDSAWYRQYRNLMAFDPVPYWRRVRVPVLAFIGGRDASVPAERTVKILDQALRSGGNRHYTIKFLPTANHIMFETAANDPYVSSRRDTSPLNAYSVLGYHDFITKWLRENVLATRPATEVKSSSPERH